MKNLTLAFLLVVTGAILCFVVLYLFGIQKEVAAPFSSFFLGAITYIHQALEQKKLTANPSLLPDQIVRLEGFSIDWYLMIIYGTFIFVAVGNLASAIPYTAAGLSNIRVERLDLLSIALSAVTSIIVMYFLGKWIGNRSNTHGLVTVMAVAFFGRLVSATIDFLIITEEQFLTFYRQPKTWNLFLVQVALGAALVSIFGIVGFWRGRRTRMSRYLHYPWQAFIRYSDRLRNYGI